jgi:hypothetical protein
MIATLYLRIERRQRVKMDNAGTRQVGNVRSSDVIEEISQDPCVASDDVLKGTVGGFQ